MEIVLHAIDRGGEHSLTHDLNFRSARYEALHTVVSSYHPRVCVAKYLLTLPTPQTFKNPKPALAAALAESGSMENGIKKKGDESAKKKKRTQQGVGAPVLEAPHTCI